MFEICRLVSFTVILIVLGIIDFKHGILPNKIVYPAVLFTLLLNLISENISIINSLIGGVSLAVFLLIVALLLKNMGMGDVKLCFLMGLMTGFPEGILALFSGIFLGGIIALVLVIGKLKNRKESIPYGPYLAAGTVFVLIGMHVSLFEFLYQL